MTRTAIGELPFSVSLRGGCLFSLIRRLRSRMLEICCCCCDEPESPFVAMTHKLQQSQPASPPDRSNELQLNRGSAAFLFKSIE
jgi:hypothetical protein